MIMDEVKIFAADSTDLEHKINTWLRESPIDIKKVVTTSDKVIIFYKWSTR